MICKDEITQEVRTAREAYAARFDYDLARMFEDLKAKEAQNPAPCASLKPHARSGSTFEAVYENGLLRPVQPLRLAEDQGVPLTLDTTTELT